MKIRNGFVSNSSSSSFIVVFPWEPTCADDVHTILFGQDEKLLGEDYYDDKFKLPSRWAAELIWRDIQKHKPDHPDFTRRMEATKEELDSLLYEDEHYRGTVVKALLEAVFLRKPVYMFEYADNESSAESILHSGAAFENAQMFCISHH